MSLLKTRTIVAALACAFAFGGAAVADVLIVKGKTGKPMILGLKSKVDDIEVTMDTWELVADRSTGVIVRDGYDGVEFAKNSRSKPTFYEADRVITSRYSSEPDDLLTAYDEMDAGAYARAISLLRDVAARGAARPVYQLEANFQIGVCYISMGQPATAAKHYAKWPAQNSKYAPIVLRIRAEIFTGKKQYDRARAEYGKIEGLPSITENWKYQAKLGTVKVGIAERKFDAAEREAKSIASRLRGKDELNDALALAYILQAEAIRQAGAEDRLNQAELTLQKAARLSGVSTSNKAYLYTVLGHTLYAQKSEAKLAEARFPYLRVACLYPGERAYAASALQNAGQVFLDMSERATDGGNADAGDELFMKGMRLLRECAGNYRGSAPAKRAGGVYLKNKDRYETLLARDDDSADDGRAKDSNPAGPDEGAKGG